MKDGVLSSVGTIHVVADGFNRRNRTKIAYKFRRNGKNGLIVSRSYGTCSIFSDFVPTVETVGYLMNRSYGTHNNGYVYFYKTPNYSFFSKPPRIWNIILLHFYPNFHCIVQCLFLLLLLWQIIIL
jgi:hypothetical protein